MNKKMVVSGLCLALCLVLPLLTGQIREFGQALLPMHLPVIICGFICGWPYGLAVGFVAPLLRSMVFGMPPMPVSAVPMAFELAAYGFFCGIMYKYMAKNIVNTYISLIVSMVCGRIVLGVVKTVLFLSMGSFGWGWNIFIGEALLRSVPGIICQLIIIPILLMALKRAGLTYNDE